MKFVFNKFPSDHLKCPIPSHPLDQIYDFQNLKGHNTFLPFAVKSSIKVERSTTAEFNYT